VFELTGFVYTLEGKAGYYLSRVNFDSGHVFDGAICGNGETYCTTRFRGSNSEKWKIYQTDGGNHPHRPIFGVSILEPWNIYRITNTPAIFLEDRDYLSDFYNYKIEVGRYRAISL